MAYMLNKEREMQDAVLGHSGSIPKCDISSQI